MLDNPIPYDYLLENSILKGPLISIAEISNADYTVIRKEGG